MLYVCLPVHNEAATVGVLLWRLRTVLQAAGRDYEVVVYDDASTDATAEVLAPYARVMALTVVGGAGARPRGRTAATVSLLRHVAAQSRHPRRDACVLFQGDFTEPPEDLPGLLAAFDAGADVVFGRRPPDPAQPAGERRLRRLGPWALRPLVRVEGVDDLLAGPRLLRVAVVRDLARARGDGPLVERGGWAGQVELGAAVAGFARRVAVVDTPGRYDVRTRASRLDWATELRALARYAWQARGTHVRPGTAAPARAERAAPEPSTSDRATSERLPRAAERAAEGSSAAPASAPSAERPRAVGRSRRARRGTGAADAATAAVDATPAEAASPAPAPADAVASAPVVGRDAASGDDAPTAARRRKRRSRGRARADGAAADTSDVGTAADAEVTSRQAVSDNRASAAPPDDASPDDASPNDASSEDAGDAAGVPARTTRRRRRRGRARSAGDSPGVSAATDGPAAEVAPADALHPADRGAPARDAPPSVPSPAPADR